MLRMDDSRPFSRFVPTPWNSTTPKTATAAVAAIASERTRVCGVRSSVTAIAEATPFRRCETARESAHEPIEEKRQQAEERDDERDISNYGRVRIGEQGECCQQEAEPAGGQRAAFQARW